MLTERQHKLLCFLWDEKMANKKTPTLKQMADHLGLGYPGQAHGLVERLIERGYIERAPCTKRLNLRIIRPPHTVSHVFYQWDPVDQKLVPFREMAS